MRNGLISLVVAGLILAAAVSASQTDCRRIVMDKAFTLKVGESGIVENHGLRIEFREVVEDSRCPRGADCIWEGNARVSLLVRDCSKEPVIVKLNSTQGNKSETVGGVTVSLISLDPYPESGSGIASADYSATLKISKDE
jgi:hypothetical protein